MKKRIVFDVNETLLDLSALDQAFERVFGRPSRRGDWFAQVLQNSLVATVTGKYDDFGKIASAALDMTAQRYKFVRDFEALNEQMRKFIEQDQLTKQAQ
jgi:hypothetical protein